MYARQTMLMVEMSIKSLSEDRPQLLEAQFMFNYWSLSFRAVNTTETIPVTILSGAVALTGRARSFR